MHQSNLPSTSTAQPETKPGITFKVDPVSPSYIVQSGALGGAFKSTKAFNVLNISDNAIPIRQTQDRPSQTNIAHENGFVHTILKAYNHHHKLIIRPDDVWLAIVVQFGLYVNGNAEELRHIFVSHEGKKQLVVYQNATLATADFERMLAEQFYKKLQANLKDKEVSAWVMPAFSTTTTNDRVVGGIALMATMQQYFNYKCCLMCGIPEITLLGTVQDWEEIDCRVKVLEKYGDKCKTWSGMLQQITSKFVQTAKGDVPIDFWKKICHEHARGSGPDYMSGWLTAFCVWNKDGKWRGRDDGRFPCVDIENIPPGYLTVPLLIDDNGNEFKTMLFAGHSSAIKVDSVTTQPRLSWAIYKTQGLDGDGGKQIDGSSSEDDSD